MKFLASRRWRIFLIAWLLFSVHFATNVVREHYPAFSLVEHGTFRVDEYQGFHPDIFVHRDGHSVIGNQVFVSMLAAAPLLVFDPVLDAVESYSRSGRQDAVLGTEYGTTDHPNSAAFYQLVKERGLELRFGAATVVTSVFFMAPVTALFLVYFYQLLLTINVDVVSASTLTFLLGFGTPIFFRTAHLNHNMFVMYGMFLAFALLWNRAGGEFSVSVGRRLAAGFLGGLTLATDYIGIVILPLLYGYLVLSLLPRNGWGRSARESVPFLIGTIPPVLFLFFSQWAMYGNPFLPGQYWMPDQNAYVNAGLRGFGWPSPDLVIQNLFHPGFGLYVWGPLLLLALIPLAVYRADFLFLPRKERRFVAIAFLALLLFCSANQYARLQWNSGFRYLIPLVPLLFLALIDHWMRMPAWARLTVGTGAILNSWVLAVFREPFWRSWELFFQESVQLPWFRVLRMTAQPGVSLLEGSLVPAAVLGAALGASWWIWSYGNRIEANRARQINPI